MCRNINQFKEGRYDLTEAVMLRSSDLILSLSLLLCLLVFPVSAATGKDTAAPAEGSSCLACHEKEVSSIGKTLHWKKAVKGSPYGDKGCISCHGSGAAHMSAEGGTTKDLITFSNKDTAQQKSGVCLSCHSSSRELAFWDSGKHKQHDVACIDCHAVHGAAPGKSLKMRQPDLCITCHKEVRGQMNKQSHHPIQEGKVKCSDCHSPHGSAGPNMIREASAPDLCYKCHAEKRGPFAFEHPPVAENCGTCHKVHGSNHENLLTSKATRLCQGCHTPNGHNNRPYNYQMRFDGSATSKNRFVGQGCLNCHGDIHGSNRSPYLVR